MKTLILITACFLLTHLTEAQVKISRYTTSQVSSAGLWGKKTLDKEIIIPEIDIDAIYKKWEGQKVSKFAEPVDVDISLYGQGYWETVESFNIIRIKITAKKASSIAVYFDKLILSPNAELYIYSADGTIITGPITEKENINSDKMWGSNVFSGTSVIIELKTPIAETDSNKLHIQKILYGINPQIKLPYTNKDSTTGPGFGLSSSCNINAICIAGWEQERRAIAQVVHGNGAWCSASLIMNTCNTNIPYVLTANHCVVDANGNPINTSNSTFEFLWFSPTCTPTTNTSSTLLFNGASIQARWEQSDFALLRLNQTIPQNSTLTFLGWSRSTNPPNNSVGIHHPMGDIMKVSIENNQATIGSVRNFPNTAWRVVWDQGTVQGGSSGSPLFDMNDHKVIGQLFSNTQPTNPPCNQPTGGTNYGRFDVSWNGGGTSATRLRDWLDPTNSGAMTTNTTNVSALANANLNLSITGGNSICNSGVFTLTGAPAGANVTWSLMSGTIPSSAATLTPNGSQVTLTQNYYTPQWAFLRANVTSACFPTVDVYKHLFFGIPNHTINVMENGVPQPDNVLNLYTPYTLGAQAYDQSPYYPYILSTSYEYASTANYIWRVYYSNQYGGNTVYNLGTFGYLDTPDFTFTDNGNYEIVVDIINNNCSGHSRYFSRTITIGSSFRYSVSPNPSTHSIKISPQNKTSTQKANDNPLEIQAIQVVDKMGVIKHRQRFGKGLTTVNVSVNQLPNDVYTLLIFDGQKWHSHKIMVQR